MQSRLSKEQVRQIGADGYYFPLPALSGDEAQACRDRLEHYEKETGHPINGTQRLKVNLLMKWADDLMRDPRILDPVEDLVGPNILCWGAHLFIKEARSPSFISWHQDSQYWGLDSANIYTAWIALSSATLHSGCMSMARGSHLQQLPHVDTFDPNNMLTRGQSITEGIDDDKTVAIQLAPGEMSLHNVRIAHSSTPNRSDDRRIGIAFRYMPTSTRQQLADWDTASLVRGEDLYGHFIHEPRPRHDFDPECVAFHARSIENEMSFLIPKDVKTSVQSLTYVAMVDELGRNGGQ